jgi:DNA-binding transcriptional regulator YiaG
MRSMPNIQSVLKTEIARLARKEVRGEVESLRKAATQHRSDIAKLKRQLLTMQRSIDRLAANGSRTRSPAAPSAAEEDTQAGPPRRFSATRLAATRKKMGLSAADFGALIGVSGQSVYKWETGEVRPRRSQLEAIASVRGLGKKETAARLETVRAIAAAETPARRKRAPAAKGAAETAPTRKRA